MPRGVSEKPVDRERQERDLLAAQMSRLTGYAEATVEELPLRQQLPALQADFPFVAEEDLRAVLSATRRRLASPVSPQGTNDPQDRRGSLLDRMLPDHDLPHDLERR